MSAPVGRETPARSANTHGRKIEALARRPAPVTAAGGTRPYIFRRLTTSEVITANGAGESLDWDTTNTTEAGTYFSAPDANTTRIESQGSGSLGEYEFRIGIKWDPEFNAGRMILVNAGGFGWFPSSWWKDPYGASGLERGDVFHTFCFTARIVTTSDFDFDIQVCHEHASDQTVIDGVLEVVYHGASAGDALGTFWF